MLHLSKAHQCGFEDTYSLTSWPRRLVCMRACAHSQRRCRALQKRENPAAVVSIPQHEALLEASAISTRSPLPKTSQWVAAAPISLAAQVVPFVAPGCLLLRILLAAKAATSPACVGRAGVTGTPGRITGACNTCS